MTWENVNKHNGIVWMGRESTFGTAASNMIALLNRADPPWPNAGATQQMIGRQDSLTSRRAYQTPVKGMKSGSPVALSVDVKPTSGRLNAAASPVAFSNASALSHQLLWRAAMGGELTPAAGTTVDSYSAPDVTVASGHGSRFAVGQWLLYEATGGALSLHQVTAIATDVLTVQPPLPGTPTSGEVIRNLYNYFLAEDDTQTFTVAHAPIEAGSNELQTRARGCVFSPELTLTLGGVPMLSLNGTSADHDGPGDLSLSETAVSDDMAAPFALDVSSGNGGLWLASSLSSTPSASLIVSLRITIPRQWQDIPGAGGVSSLAARKEVAGPQQQIQVEIELRGGTAEVTAFANMSSRHLVLFGLSGTGTSGRAFLVHVPNAVPAVPPTVQINGELAFCRAVLTAQRNTLGTTDLAASNVVVAWG